MTSRLYDRITGGSVILAVIAALLFEHLGPRSWVAGLLGILAAVAAIVTYFVNQSRMTEIGGCPKDAYSSACAPPDIDKSSLVSEQLSHLSMEGATYGILHYSDFADVSSSEESVIAIHGEYGRIYRRVAVRSNPSDLFVNRVVEIVDKLCSSETDLEFILTPEGKLPHSSVKTSSMVCPF